MTNNPKTTKLAEKFWVVLDPTDVSVIEDILFHTNLDSLRLQFLGGLVLEGGQLYFGKQQALHGEAGVHSLEAVVAPDEQSGRNHERQRESHLCHDESTPNRQPSRTRTAKAC